MKGENNNMQESYLNECGQQKSGTSPLQNGDRTRFYFQKLLNIEHSLSTIVAINISLVVIYSSQAFNYQVRNKLILDIILYGIFACSLVQIIITISRVKCKLELEKEQRMMHSSEGVMSSGAIYYLLLEALVFITQPNPFLSQYKMTLTSSVNSDHQYYFYVNEILCILSLFRVYVFGRVLLLNTTYMSPRSHRLCRLHGCQATYQYALKCLFKDKPSLLILIGFGASIIIFGFAIQICQRPLVRSQIVPTNLGLFQNAIWLTFETMTTVGFGDLYPYTVFGRVIVLIVVVWGIFIVPIMVVVITNTLQMEKAEIRTLVVLNRLATSSQLKQLAAEFIGAVMKGRKETNFKKLEKRKKDILRLRQQFKKKNIQLKSLEYNDDTYQQMSRKFQELNEDIKILNKNQEQLIFYVHNNFQHHPESQQQQQDPINPH